MVRRGILCVFAALLCMAALGKEKILNAIQFERTDFVYVIQGEWENPYLEIVDMVFVNPDGEQGVQPCFWENGCFHARFAPCQAGTFTVRFRHCTKEGCTMSEPFTLKVRKSRARGFLHPNDNWTFRYDNGDLFRGVGLNLCWESRIVDDNPHLSQLHQRADLYNYDVMLPKLSECGGNFTRMWMCQWNFPLDRQRDFNNARYQETSEWINPSVARRMDHVFSLSDSLGIRIMLCMGQGNVTADRDFFTRDECKDRYKAYLRYIVARWGYSPAIACWEFFNEIDNIQYADSENPIPSAEIVEWHREMAHYLKSIDAHHHMVTTSISHRDLEGLNDIADIDFNQKHMYRCVDQIPQTLRDYTSAHGKPYVIGEAGAEWDWYKDFELIKDDMFRDFTRAMMLGLENPTPILPMNWWWEWYDSKDYWKEIKRIRKKSDSMLRKNTYIYAKQ